MLSKGLRCSGERQRLAAAPPHGECDRALVYSVIPSEVLSEFSEAEKSAFLRFVWARPTLPPAGVDFPQKMKIQSSVGDDANAASTNAPVSGSGSGSGGVAAAAVGASAQQKSDQYLPKAHTCFFSINLPKYSSKTVMAAKLRYAITQCTEMDADYRITDTEVAGWSSLPSAAVGTGRGVGATGGATGGVSQGTWIGGGIGRGQED